MNQQITIITASYNTSLELLERYYNSVLNQTYQNFEVIIVDDGSSFNHYDIIKDSRFRIIYRDYNSGACGECKNIGVENSNNDIIFFTDIDCEIAPNVLETVLNSIQGENILQGNTITQTKSFIGKAIALLGYPCGGILGYDKVWKIKNGYTEFISGCNFAVRKQAYIDIGMLYNCTFGEETIFAQKAVKQGYKIKYVPELVVYHIERNSIKSFISWHIKRGIGAYLIRKNIGQIRGILGLRIWSFKNSLIAAGPIYAPAVFFLMIISVICQFYGYCLKKFALTEKDKYNTTKPVVTSREYESEKTT